jgi:hypothetical protein
VDICEPSVVIERQAEKLTGQDVWPVRLAALLLSLGFRLAQGINHQDVVGDLPHLEDFKTAKPQDLRRTITWRFSATELEWKGEKLGVEAAAARLESNADFLEQVEQQPNYEEVKHRVEELLKQRPICLRCRNPRAHDRTLIVPMGGDTKLIATLAKEYEEGF